MREEGAKPEKLSAPKPQSGGCAQCLQGTQSQGLHGFLSTVLGTARDDPTDAESGTAPATRRHGGRKERSPGGCGTAGAASAEERAEAHMGPTGGRKTRGFRGWDMWVEWDFRFRF